MQDEKTPITIKSAFEGLKSAGYSRAYVQKFLPEWWDNSLLKTSSGAFQFALILKQCLGLEVNFENDGSLVVAPRTINANFKHRADTRAEELAVAASLGMALARLAHSAIHNHYSELPRSPVALYEQVREITGRPTLDFDGLLELCWAHGIPVLFLGLMPNNSKKMAGMAVKVNDRPAILLGFSYTNHSRQLFVLAHELAHIICGHVQNNGAVVDEDIRDVSEALEGSAQVRPDEEEVEADLFALSLIRNDVMDIEKRLPRTNSAATLAVNAMQIGKDAGVDQGHLILSYAKEHDDWIRANQAINFIEQEESAIELLCKKFGENTDLTKVSDESARHLLFMQGIIR